MSNSWDKLEKREEEQAAKEKQELALRVEGGSGLLSRAHEADEEEILMKELFPKLDINADGYVSVADWVVM